MLLIYMKVTITTVGYGDVYPVTTGGRFLAAVVAYVGPVVTLSITSGIVASGFADIFLRESFDKKISTCLI